MAQNQFIYRFIYNDFVNRILRNINKTLSPVLPKGLRLPPSGIIEVKTNAGTLIKLKTNQTNYLTQLVYWNGLENFEYSDIFIRLIKQVGLFYDIGANIGYYSVLAVAENPDIKVVGFEPASGPLYYFNENVRINNLKNVKVESLALSEKDGVIDFYEIRNNKYSYLEHNLAGESNAGSLTEGRNFTKVEVKTTTLDKYVERNETGIIDLIKMDTEGTEHFILEHAHNVLRQMQPIVICETLFDTIEPQLERIFSDHGYLFYNHVENGLQKVDHIVRKVDNGVRNCFFVPPSKVSLIQKFVI